MAERICPVCGYEGRGKKQLRGSRNVEILIWTTLFVPGPLYSIWRRSAVPELCPNCGRGRMVSLRSDAGYVVKKRLELELGTSNTTPRSSSSSDAGVSLTDNSHTPQHSKTSIDPDQW